MNKKFSTLLTGMALLGGVMSVNAQDATVSQRVDPENALGKEWNLGGLKEGANAGLYQLKATIEENGTATDVYLAMVLDRQTGDYKLRTYNAADAKANLEATLWCVSVSSYNQGQAPIYDFQNKLSGTMLDITMAGHEKTEAGLKGAWNPVLGGEIAGWAFSRSYKKLEVERPLYSYFSTDSIVGLKAYVDGKVQVAKWGANQVGGTADMSNFTLVGAGQIALSADQVNTKLGLLQDKKAGVQLTFNPDVKGTSLKNPFNEQKFVAEDKDNDKWLFIKQKDKDAYLKVDTAYTNKAGAKFLAYGWTEKLEGKADAYNSIGKAIRDQHKFKFIYSPSGDSLYIYVKKVTWNNDGKYWNTHLSETAVNEYEFWRVSLQDLIKDETCILTVDPENDNTHISLGLSGCEEKGSFKTSVDDGVYFIKNKKGQYLASPIYADGNIRWTTVNGDEQSVAHMPAYQWVVLKKNTSNDKVKAVSPVTISNREYADNVILSDLDGDGQLEQYKTAVYSTVQLRKAEGGSYMFVYGNELQAEWGSVGVDSLFFEKVPAASISDPYLGYRKLEEDSLLVNKYTFNYWHPYATDKYIAKSSDSTLTVLVGKDGFVIETLPETWNADKSEKTFATIDIPYGYKVSEDVAKNRIKGLKTLVRTAYKVSYKDNKGDLSQWKVNKEDKFNVGSSAKGNQQGVTTYYAFFKENNHIGGKHYYAIVNATSNDTKYVLGYKKAGVSDYDGAATLKDQVLSETRTSAFAIEPDNTPLYRRFNSLELEGNEGDKADTLRFIEKYRKEYLQVENNPNFMKEGIDFLGIYTPEKTEDGLSFIVDTAWVKRGAGNIKPQYLISIERNDFEGVEGVACTEDDHHFTAEGEPTDKWHCVHAKPAVPGFERGKYLINFHDFAVKHNEGIAEAKKDAAYMWKKYDRAGFVEAIRVADTLYILRDEFKNLPNEKINFADLNKAEEAAWAAAKKAGVSKENFVSYKYILSGDNHKYVTWSMRFVNKEIAANEVEEDRAFLFESMAANRGSAIAPKKAAWLKMQNGCLVLSDATSSSFDETVTGGDDALIFNVEQGDDIATDNETIEAVEGVSVVAGNGTVTVQGAAGKSVVITNILGKVVAETVLTSDNATIAVPAGIVAVAVDGEEAVKAIVK